MKDSMHQDYGEFFRTNEFLYKQLLEEVNFMIKRSISESGIKIHSCGGRVKDLQSALEKIQRKEYSDPQSQIEDVVGYRIVCLFASDLGNLADIVSEHFTVLSLDEKVEGKEDPATFGYMSNHYICRLKPTYSGPRYDGLKEIIFEVQCRTLLMDAWANVSHYLAYKGDASIPENLRRDFYALSGLFYVADKHFELFYSEATSSAEAAITKVSSGDTGDDSVNRETVRALLRQLYPDRQAAPPGTVSEFVEEIVPLGYTSIKTLKGILEEMDEMAKRDEEAKPPGRDSLPGAKYWDLGIARLSLRLKDSRYREFLEKKDKTRSSSRRRRSS